MTLSSQPERKTQHRQRTACPGISTTRIPIPTLNTSSLTTAELTRANFTELTRQNWPSFGLRNTFPLAQPPHPRDFTELRSKKLSPTKCTEVFKRHPARLARGCSQKQVVLVRDSKPSGMKHWQGPEGL